METGGRDTNQNDPADCSCTTRPPFRIEGAWRLGNGVPARRLRLASVDAEASATALCACADDARSHGRHAREVAARCCLAECASELEYAAHCFEHDTDD